MKRFLLWFFFGVVFALLTACGGKTNAVKAPEIPEAHVPNTDKTLQLFGRGGIGQACPVDGTIYTAAHMVQYERESDGAPVGMVKGYAFSTVEGNHGIVVPAAVNSFRDLALLYLNRGEVNYYTLGSPPEPGDSVYWREYNWDEDDGDLLGPTLIYADVTLIVAGHVIVNNYPEDGASGGCLFNEDGEVVGVVTWNVFGYGVAALITGSWGL